MTQMFTHDALQTRLSVQIYPGQTGYLTPCNRLGYGNGGNTTTSGAGVTKAEVCLSPKTISFTEVAHVEVNCSY